MSEPDFRSKFKNSAQVLHSLFENGKSPLSEQFLRWKLWAQWSEIVGTTISEQAEPVGLRNGVLYLWVRNSTWMQQFYFMKRQILQTLHKKAGLTQIRDLSFTLDRHSVPGLAEQQDKMKEIISKIAGPESDKD